MTTGHYGHPRALIAFEFTWLARLTGTPCCLCENTQLKAPGEAALHLPPAWQPPIVLKSAWLALFTGDHRICAKTHNPTFGRALIATPHPPSSVPARRRGGEVASTWGAAI